MLVQGSLKSATHLMPKFTFQSHADEVHTVGRTGRNDHIYRMLFKIFANKPY